MFGCCKICVEPGDTILCEPFSRLFQREKSKIYIVWLAFLALSTIVITAKLSLVYFVLIFFEGGFLHEQSL